MKRGGPARPITLHKVTMWCKAVRESGIIKAEVKNRNERMVSIVSGDNARPLSYMMEHLGLLGSLTRGWGTAAPPCSVCFVLRRLRTRFVKSRSTFCAVLALVSRNSQPNSLASCTPSSRVTSRSSCLSALLPTSRTKDGQDLPNPLIA